MGLSRLIQLFCFFEAVMGLEIVLSLRLLRSFLIKDHLDFANCHYYSNSKGYGCPMYWSSLFEWLWLEGAAPIYSGSAGCK